MSHVWRDRVLETSSSTGTGNFTLAGAVAGFRTFASVCSTNDTVYYYIEAVDSNGVPTGDWETGLGTYSASNTLTRTTVLDSSNSGSAVSFSAGTKRVGLSILSGIAMGYQFARVDGAGSNSATAFATKGRIIRPLADCHVKRVAFNFLTVSGASYKAYYGSVSGNTITVLGSSSTFVAPSAAQITKSFEINLPMVTDGEYFVALTRTDSTTTYALPIAQATTGSFSWTTNFAAGVYNGFTLASVGPTNGDTVTQGTSAFSGDIVFAYT